MHLRLLWSLDKLHKFINDGASLVNAWRLSKGLLDDLSVARMSEFHSSCWAGLCSKASLRLKEAVCQQGPVAVLKMLEGKTGQSIEEAKSMLSGMEGLTGRLLQMHASLQDMDQLHTYTENKPSDLAQVCKQMPGIVKIVNYNLDVIHLVKPDQKAAVMEYLGDVNTVLRTNIQTMTQDALRWKKLVERYQPLFSIG